MEQNLNPFYARKDAMIKKFFDLKRRKTLPEAAVLYAVFVAAYIVLSNAAEGWLSRGF